MSRPRILDVPIRGQTEFVEIDLDHLPIDAAEIYGFLNSEKSPARFYLSVGVEYLKIGQTDEAIKVIQGGLENAGDIESDSKNRLSLLNSLAQLFIRKAKTSKDRDRWLEQVTKILNQADQTNPREITNWISKGLLYLAQRKPDDAMKQFTEVIKHGEKDNVTALLGKARVHFHRKQFTLALQGYQDVLRLYPNGPPDVRIGIGLCFHRLGMMKESKAAFERAAELDPDNANAIALLSIMELNEFKSAGGAGAGGEDGHKKVTLGAGLKHVRQAYETDKTNVLACCQLADHLFFRNDMQRALHFGQNALEHATNSAVQAEACYQIGRTYHKSEKFEEAYQHYKKAVQSNPEHALAMFSLGQLHIHRAEYPLAIECYEKVNAKNPKNIETLVVLGSLYSRNPATKAKALDCFEKVMKYSAEDHCDAAREPAMYIEMARLLEDTEPRKALKALLSAETLFGETGTVMPADFLLNVGALYHLHGEYDNAKTYYQRAMSTAEQKQDHSNNDASADQDDRDACITTILYNLARLSEDTDDVSNATEAYKKLLDRHPGYVDAHLRLGYIAQQAGQLDVAGDHYADALACDRDRADTIELLSGLQYTQNQIRSSRKGYERVLHEIDRRDGYALTALGNLHCQAARHEKEMKGKDAALMKAMEMYDYALRYDDHNAYAANGIAVAIAEKGTFEVAKHMFYQIREACGNMHSVWMNLGHVLVELDQLQEALMVYESCAKKFNDTKDTSLLLCMARVHYMLAKAEKSTEETLAAVETTQKVRDLLPNDRDVQYDMGLVLQTYAQNIAEKPQDQRTVLDLEKAQEKLDEAKTIFQVLLQFPKDRYSHYDHKVCEQRLKYCDSLRTTIARRIVTQRAFDENLEREQEEARRKREDEQARLLAQQEEEKRQMEERQRKIDEQRMTIINEMREKNEREAELAREAAVSDGEGDGEGGVDRVRKRRSKKEPKEPKPPKEKKERKTRKRRAVDSERSGSEGEQDLSEAEERRPKKRRSPSPEEAEASATEDVGKSGGGRRKQYKSKAIIESDDED